MTSKSMNDLRAEPSRGWLDEVAEKVDLTGVLTNQSPQRQSFAGHYSLKPLLAQNYVGVLKEAVAHLESEMEQSSDPLVKLALFEDAEYFREIMREMSPLDPLILQLVYDRDFVNAVTTFPSDRIETLQLRLGYKVDEWLHKHLPETLTVLWRDLQNLQAELRSEFLRRYRARERPDSFDDVPLDDRNDPVYRAIVKQAEFFDPFLVQASLLGYGELLTNPSL